MSEIPFLGALGDAIESAVTSPSSHRRRPSGRRHVLLAVAATVVVGGAGVAVAQLGEEPETLAVNGVACYERADLTGDVSVRSAGGLSPISLCAESLAAGGGKVPPLVACTRGSAVVVLPGRTVDACRANDLDPMPPGYDAARAKVADLAKRIAAIEQRADCIPPRRLAAAAQAALDRGGWTGWRTVVEPSGGAPCGLISRQGGASLDLGPAMRPETGEVVVTTGPPRSLTEQLFGPRALGAQLIDASGARCFTPVELQEYTIRKLAPIGLDVRFRTERLPANSGMVAPRGERYAEGCAISLGAYPVYPDDGQIAIEAEIAVDRD